MSKVKLDLNDIYNKGDKIDAALENTLRETGMRCRKWDVGRGTCLSTNNEGLDYWTMDNGLWNEQRTTKNPGPEFHINVWVRGKLFNKAVTRRQYNLAESLRTQRAHILITN